MNSQARTNYRFLFVSLNYQELNIIPVLNKIQDYKRKWILQHVNRMPRKRLPRLEKKENYTRKTTEETSGCVRPERVNKWPNSWIAT
jgi:hypothetical protein